MASGYIGVQYHSMPTFFEIEFICSMLSLETDDFNTLFFSGWSKQVYYEWNGADPKDECPYSFGEVGFPDEFYKDLFKLSSKVCGYGGGWYIDNAIVSGEKGYYTGYITLTEEGLSERTVYYTGEEDF